MKNQWAGFVHMGVPRVTRVQEEAAQMLTPCS